MSIIRLYLGGPVYIQFTAEGLVTLIIYALLGLIGLAVLAVIVGGAAIGIYLARSAHYRRLLLQKVKQALPAAIDGDTKAIAFLNTTRVTLLLRTIESRSPVLVSKVRAVRSQPMAGHLAGVLLPAVLEAEISLNVERTIELYLQIVGMQYVLGQREPYGYALSRLGLTARDIEERLFDAAREHAAYLAHRAIVNPACFVELKDLLMRLNGRSIFEQRLNYPVNWDYLTSLYENQSVQSLI